MNKCKRKFLIHSSGLLTLSLASKVPSVFAEWNESHFVHKSLDELLISLTDSTTPTSSEDIRIKAPEIAENGAVVPITVNSTLANVTQISIIVDNNPAPLTSTFDINPQLEAYVSTRVKMAKSSNIIALVSTEDNKFYTASKSIKVTIGGCGG